MKRPVKWVITLMVALVIAWLIVLALLKLVPPVRNGDHGRSFTVGTLRAMEVDITRWYRRSDPKQRESVRHVRTMYELACHLKAKDASVEVDGYLNDWWSRPFNLDIREEGSKTIIR